MSMIREKQTKIEFGDFQTPLNLARDVCAVIAATGFSPASVIEPTCGRGAFLQAALETFPNTAHFLGVERNDEYVQYARVATNHVGKDGQVQILQRDFFDADWINLVAGLPKPVLILGNPPWVTNAAIGALNGANLPAKANLDNLRGLDALTGKSNFDVSEWMLRENFKWLADTAGMLAVLCKTAVARKVLFYAWSQNLPIEFAEVRRIDAKLHFGAAVDACLLIVKLRLGAQSKQCGDYRSLVATEPQSVLGLREGMLVADVQLYDRRRDLLGCGLSGWRSGIKHDCSDLFELTQKNGDYENGLGMRVDIEDDLLFPLLKSSDLAGNRRPRKWLLVPQRTMAGSPEDLQRTAPKAWQYLLANDARLAARGSSIYRNRPRFSIFGVGDYSFAPWKVAISGLYKKLDFVVVPPFQDRPVVLDDTCYFFPCQSEHECSALYALVSSQPAREFWSAFVFWDAKRPVTAQTLNLLDFAALARAANLESGTTHVLADRQIVPYSEGAQQQLLFREQRTVEPLGD